MVAIFTVSDGKGQAVIFTVDAVIPKFSCGYRTNPQRSLA